MSMVYGPSGISPSAGSMYLVVHPTDSIHMLVGNFVAPAPIPYIDHSHKCYYCGCREVHGKITCPQCGGEYRA